MLYLTYPEKKENKGMTFVPAPFYIFLISL